ncbi:MAG: UDP-N-acetylmuramate dehydrogenase [Deltaproteobacteria bacterium]|nr:UDP-N-acetylmuramate dehydrogenase [Deltaproteobacteria bacterium]
MKAHQKGQLERFFRGTLLYETPLRDFLSFKVGGPADVVAFPADVEDLISLVHFLREQEAPFFVLGEGTNLLVRDGGYRGVVIRLLAESATIEIEREAENTVYVRAHAGERLSRLLEFSLDKSLSGLEFAVGIPGSVGGALFMNAGAYGGEIKDVTFSVRILTADGTLEDVPQTVLRFSYRKLEIPPHAIIVEALFGLQKGIEEEVRAIVAERFTRRRQSQPWGFPNAGSVFKNPPGYHAAQLIEDVGLKGCQIGGAAVSSRHANFIVNQGSASARDILDLISHIQDTVWEKKGIQLEPEIHIVGEDGT